MTTNPCPQNIWNHTTGCICTPNGTITAEVDVDLFDLRAEAQQAAARLRADADAHVALAHRIEAYSMLKDYPDGYQVETVLWPEDANEDGTFDVNLGAVLNDNGDEIENFEGNPGAVPAGWFNEEGQPRTAFDAWRDPSTDPNAPIQVAKAHEWFTNYSAKRAADLYGTDPQFEKARTQIFDVFQRIKAQPASGANGVTRRVGLTDVGVSLYAVRDSDGMVKERGTVGDVTLTGRGKHLTFPFGQPSDPDNHETYEEAQAAAAKVLAEWSD